MSQCKVLKYRQVFFLLCSLFYYCDLLCLLWLCICICIFLLCSFLWLSLLFYYLLHTTYYQLPTSLPLATSRDTPITFREKYSTNLVKIQIYHRHIIVLYRTVLSLWYYCDITVISLWYIWNMIGGRPDADRNVCVGFKSWSGCFFLRKRLWKT
jgi:hypothetical protein